MRWITEENYEQTMRQEVEPYLAARRETGYDERIKGKKLYYEHFRADNPRGVIVISHGFTESIKKYSEAIYYMLQQGYNVFGVDHHGHGRSYRRNENPYVVDTNRFDDYVRDLHHAIEYILKPVSGGLPLYLYAHSMGGCIGAWMIERYPDLFQKAVLTSPMLGLSFGKIPIHVVYAAASVKGIGARKHGPLEPVYRFEQEPDFEHSCDSSECRYLYYHKKRLEDPALQMNSPSINWGKHAVRFCSLVRAVWATALIRIPVLLCQAGEDTVVKNASQDLFASRVKNCELFRVPGMKHELYMTDSPVLIPYWEKIFSFLEA